MSSLPETQLGVLSTKTSRTIKTFSVPTPDADEVLVRNVAVASNPKDWKYPLWRENYVAIEGNDVAGYVAAVGSKVTEFKMGDKVAAFSKMATGLEKYGAYAQFTVAPAATTFPLGPNTSFEDAATLPLAAMTAAIGLFRRLAIPQPPADSIVVPDGPEAEAIVINGASSSVGTFAVQLAKRAGFFVVGVAGSGSALAKEMGVDVVVDYRSEKDLGPAILAALSSHPCSYVYDAIANKGGPSLLCTQVLAKTKAGPSSSVKKYTTVLPISEEEKSEIAVLEPKVETVMTMVGTAYGDDIDFAAKYYRLMGQWLELGSFKPNKVKLVPGGLAGVDAALKDLQENKISAEKLVYRIADTPGLNA